MAGPWVAERLAAIEEFFWRKSRMPSIPSTREIIAGAARYTAVGRFPGILSPGGTKARGQIKSGKILILWRFPRRPTVYTVDEVNADPVAFELEPGGLIRIFVNLFGFMRHRHPEWFFYANGLPIGMTLLAPAFREGFLCAVAEEFLSRAGLK